MQQTTLARRHLSTTAVVFMIIAASAPLTVLAGGVPTRSARTAARRTARMCEATVKSCAAKRVCTWRAET